MYISHADLLGLHTCCRSPFIFAYRCTQSDLSDSDIYAFKLVGTLHNTLQQWDYFSDSRHCIGVNQYWGSTSWIAGKTICKT